jgi:hypothetical protein
VALAFAGVIESPPALNLYSRLCNSPVYLQFGSEFVKVKFSHRPQFDCADIHVKVKLELLGQELFPLQNSLILAPFLVQSESLRRREAIPLVFEGACVQGVVLP